MRHGFPGGGVCQGDAIWRENSDICATVGYRKRSPDCKKEYEAMKKKRQRLLHKEKKRKYIKNYKCDQRK